MLPLLALVLAKARSGQSSNPRDFVRGTAFFFGRTVIGGCFAFAKREMEWE
jgi:hypothetical protein